MAQNSLLIAKTENDKYFYTCDECDCQFEDVDQHIKDFHANEEILVEDGEKANEDLQPIKESDEMEVEYLHEEVEEATETPAEVQSDLYECDQCDKLFSSEKSYKRHKDRFHRPKGQSAIVVFAYDPITNKCKKLTFDSQPPSETNESIVLQQYKNLFSDKPKPTPPPTLEFRTKRVNDLIGFDEIGSHCDICNTSFATLGGLKLHSKMHLTQEVRSIQDLLPNLVDQDSEKFHCLLCDRSFDVTFREIHMASHNNPEPVYCKVCNKQFENEQYLELHMKALKDHNSFNFGQKDKLEVEPGKGTSDPTRLYACDTCGRRFKRPHEKVKHERIHTGLRPHKCEICLKPFRTQTSLTNHLRSHTDLRPYECKICSKTFKAKPTLYHHMMTHKNAKSYKCDMCEKTFNTRVQLSGHKNYHTKNFSCPDCSRRFANLYSLRRHAITHDTTTKAGNTFKYECHICGASYTRNLVQMYHEHLLNEHKILTNFVKPDKKAKKARVSTNEPAFFQSEKVPTVAEKIEVTEPVENSDEDFLEESSTEESSDTDKQ